MRQASVLLLCAILGLSSCAYHFQGKKNPLKDLGIQKIYVSGFRNKTYRPGVEHLFTSAMIREIQKAGSFELVNSESEADAVLSGQVMTADSNIAGSLEKELSNEKVGNTEVLRKLTVASEFTAVVNCTVQLTDRSGRVIFTRSEAGSKNYPGATRLGEAGATVPTVNESEQRLAIQFLASQMMSSAYQRMVDVF